MTYETYHKQKVGQHILHPETQMMGYGYDPHLSEGALKPPVFLTSTFVFRNAQEGKDFFDYASGRREPPAGTSAGLVYSRFNNPNLEVLEDRLALWDGAQTAAVFASGMAAIATTLLAYLRPGDSILISRPLYGGTEGLVDKVMPQFGINVFGFTDGCSADEVREAAQAARAKGRVGLILVETPANPTNGLVDLQLMAAVADELGQAQGFRPPVAVDNTFLGPVYQQPLQLGADLVLYSLTKYAGGHSDLVAGAVTGPKTWVGPVKALRGALGTQADPNTAWMLMRSLETLSLRMERANTNAAAIAAYLKDHPKVASVNYLGFLQAGDPRKAVYDRQCKAPGSTFSFYVKGGEPEAFRFLDALQVIKLAVSLGGTESLCSHPASTTHSGIPAEQRARSGVTDAMIRLSVGIENPDDLIADLEQALAAI
ncbi:cystathionine gamma-synthase family protein [Pedomonas mirosovicensis]|uniref:cystathionine gamma-synthase family protein n=1 Tax=Pedomonas mirosovicensis TaxID=2908641 RepID=UPI002167FBF4|nr:cystathionine gamma-synthase family protein [Pedomonas mirosovicensis]MCH8684283.1 cystathionine gamma-synthase family protein [Pedomonas mirosovicensis]